MHQAAAKDTLNSKYLFDKDLNVSFTDTGFDIACVLPDIDDDEISHWCRGPMQWGLFKADHILFFVLDNGEGMVMAAAFNICEIKRKKLAYWLEAGTSEIQLLLIEKHTEKIRAIRSIRISKEIAGQIKKYLHIQYIRYDNRQAVQEQVAKLERRYGSNGMMAKAAAYNCKWEIPEWLL